MTGGRVQGSREREEQRAGAGVMFVVFASQRERERERERESWGHELIKGELSQFTWVDPGAATQPTAGPRGTRFPSCELEGQEWSQDCTPCSLVLPLLPPNICRDTSLPHRGADGFLQSLCHPPSDTHRLGTPPPFGENPHLFLCGPVTVHSPLPVTHRTLFTSFCSSSASMVLVPQDLCTSRVPCLGRRPPATQLSPGQLLPFFYQVSPQTAPQSPVCDPKPCVTRQPLGTEWPL
jgi:hypothetical protein